MTDDLIFRLFFPTTLLKEITKISIYVLNNDTLLYDLTKGITSTKKCQEIYF